MPTLRKDPIGGRWVIIATERNKRPSDYGESVRSPQAEFCPFCAGNEDATPPPIAEERTGDGWDVRVVPNKFPALRSEGEITRRGEGIYDEMSGIGAHEVIIECPEHISDIAELDTAQIEKVLRVWADRLRELRQDPRLRCAIVFKNHGAQAGASLEHAHSQLIALPIVPKRLAEELEGAKKYQEFRDRCVFDDILQQELDSEERLVYQNEDIVVIAPYASRFPFELWFLPRRGEPWYEHADLRTYHCLAEALQVVCRKLNRALDHPPYNLMLHSAPFTDEDMSHFTWHLELIPTLTKVAGFEWGTGFYINPTPPEEAAKHLRDMDI